MTEKLEQGPSPTLAEAARALLAVLGPVWEEIIEDYPYPGDVPAFEAMEDAERTLRAALAAEDARRDAVAELATQAAVASAMLDRGAVPPYEWGDGQRRHTDRVAKETSRKIDAALARCREVGP